MDARAATWRYFVLNEQSQVLRITSGADAASEKLDYAKRDLKDPKVTEMVNRLQAVVPEYITALKSTITAIDTQNRIEKQRGQYVRRRRPVAAARHHRDGHRAQRQGDP